MSNWQNRPLHEGNRQCELRSREPLELNACKQDCKTKPDRLRPGKSKNIYEEHTVPLVFAVANSPRNRHAAVDALAAVKIAVFCWRST